MKDLIYKLKSSEYKMLALIVVTICIIAGYIIMKPKDYSTNIDGREAVDLGLSVLWGVCNVGAESPKECGDYFAWGEIATKDFFATYNCETNNKDFRWINNYVDHSNNLTKSHDAACQYWGECWRMPTKEEFQELITNCKWIWAQKDGQYGYNVVGKNGNSIFLPAAGCGDGSFHASVNSCGGYWSATTYYEYGDFYNHCLIFNDNKFELDRSSHYFGRSVRPVCNKIK